eukprot:14200806-Ditylum_brightwellii.AAC.1
MAIRMVNARNLRRCTAGHMAGVNTLVASGEQKQPDTMMRQQKATDWVEMVINVNDGEGAESYGELKCINNLMFLLTHNNSAAPPPQQMVVAKTDSGATSHYFTSHDKYALHDIKALINGKHVKLPNIVELQTTEMSMSHYTHL